MTGWAWPAGAATGIGSLPGDDIVEATKFVLGELAELPHLPELPARGAVQKAVSRALAPDETKQQVVMAVEDRQMRHISLFQARTG
mgnify:CR=1 FL=1